MTLIAIALTFTSGAMDVASFTRLGSVFTSVMTGNIVLWGLAVARGSLALASHTAVAVAGYIAGVAGATWIAYRVRTVRPGGTEDPGDGSAGASPAGADQGGADPAGAGPAGADQGGADPAGAGPAGAGPGGAVFPDGAGRGGAVSPDGAGRGGPGPGGAVSPDVRWALRAELVLLAGFAVGWEISGASPAGWAQFCLLAVASAAMGVQSAAVKDMGLAEVSTTYLTGTLTGLVSSLIRPDQDTPHGVRRFGVLIGLVAGASLSGLLIATAAGGVPALPLAALIFTLVLASGLGWPGPRSRAPGSFWQDRGQKPRK
jgi:uncharacterized membrane protein YoaK (UPF0700 family)